ncbi:MAG: hypothetical protein WCZ72_03685 [Gemmobacter sp.]
MEWDIRPYDGLGPLRLGMSPAEVAALPEMGAPEAVDTAFDGSVVEFRGLFRPACNFAGGRLVVIDTGWRVQGVRFGGAELYRLDPAEAMRLLERAAGGASLDMGTVFFMAIGVNASGFWLEQERRFRDPVRDGQDDRGIAVFARGVFDEFLPEHQPVSFL